MSDENEGTSVAVAKLERADMDLPVWDRTGDMVSQFGADLELRWRIAKMLAGSGMVRERKPEAVMAIMLKAFEMGVPLMQAMSGMYFVDGKIALEGHLMDALAIQRCGVTKTIHEATDRACRLTLHREGWDDVESDFDLEKAKQAGAIKDYDPETGKIEPARSSSGKMLLTYVKHTEEMLYWRALSKGLKRIAPDYFGGVYTLDELQEAAEMKEASGHVSTNEELDALVDGVEPDPDALTEDEIDQMRSELSEAVELELIDQARQDALLEAAVAGEWEAAREGWDEVRGMLVEHKAAEHEEQAALEV